METNSIINTVWAAADQSRPKIQSRGCLWGARPIPFHIPFSHYTKMAGKPERVLTGKWGWTAKSLNNNKKYLNN